MLPNGSIAETRRVLLIESTQTDRLQLRSWLTAERIEVYDAVDIITGLAGCSMFQPNLILVQTHLPTWNGYEVIRRLKDDPRTLSIPVIFLSSNATTAEKARGIDMGAVDFISKPFDSVELLARVHSALRTKAYLDLLEHRAHIDGLTELSNRHALQHRLPHDWDSCLRRGKPLAIMILDLDHFKRINDHYGHAAGDEVLRRLAVTLRGSFREGDFIARYGGEEFVVLAPDCDLACAAARAESFRETVAALQIEFRTSSIKVSASIGIAMAYDPSQSNPFEALDQADQALYRAKGSGRNAVWIWDSRQQIPIAREAWRAEAGGEPHFEAPGQDEAANPVATPERGAPKPEFERLSIVSTCCCVVPGELQEDPGGK